MDAGALDGLVGGWLAERLPAGDCSAVAVDGKTLRGSVGGDGRRVHLLAALVHGHGTVVAQRQVAAKTSEIGAFAPMLDGVELAGRVVTADSLHTQRAHARYLVEQRQAAYLLVVKGNQAGMVAAIDRIGEQAFPPPHHTVDRGHGRIEHRTTRVAAAPPGLGFPHAQQVVIVQRHTTDLAAARRVPRSSTRSPARARTRLAASSLVR